MSTIFSVPLYIITQCLSVMAHWSLCWTTSNSCFNQFLTVMFQIKGHTDNLFIWTNHLTKKKKNTSTELVEICRVKVSLFLKNFTIVN